MILSCHTHSGRYIPKSCICPHLFLGRCCAGPGTLVDCSGLVNQVVDPTGQEGKRIREGAYCSNENQKDEGS